jgi:hypothetical protein
VSRMWGEWQRRRYDWRSVSGWGFADGVGLALGGVNCSFPVQLDPELPFRFRPIQAVPVGAAYIRCASMNEPAAREVAVSRWTARAGCRRGLAFCCRSAC